MGEYRNSRTNLHLIKGKAISSFEALNALVDDCVKHNPRAKKFEIDLDPKLTLSLIKSNELITLDEPRNQFLKNLRKYVDTVEKTRSQPLPSTSSRPHIGDDPTLRIIQDNTVFSANLRLASEANPHTISMQSWADSSSVTYPKRVLQLKECGDLLKTVRKVDQEIDVLTSEPQSKHNNLVHSLSNNCYHCPSLAYSKSAITTAGAKLADQHKNAFVKVQFTDRIVGGFNALRARPLDSITDIISHLESVHSICDASVSQRHLGHNYLLWCRLCPAREEEFSPHLFVCCLSHLQVVEGRARERRRGKIYSRIHEFLADKRTDKPTRQVYSRLVTG